MRKQLLDEARKYGFQPLHPTNTKLKEIIKKSKYSVKNFKITEDGRDIYIDFPYPNLIIGDKIIEFLRNINDSPISIGPFNEIFDIKDEKSIIRYIFLLKVLDIPIEIKILFYDNILYVDNNNQLLDILKYFQLPDDIWKIEALGKRGENNIGTERILNGNIEGEYQVRISRQPSSPIEEEIIEINDILNRTPYTEYPHLFRFIMHPTNQGFPERLYDGDINCVYRICRQKSRNGKQSFVNAIANIYRNINWEEQNPGADKQIVEQFCKTAIIKGTFYTELGRDIKKPFKIINETNKRAGIHLVVRNYHCTLMNDKQNTEKVVYRTLDKVFNVKGILYRGNDWCTNKTTMYKVFRPSSLTNKTIDDENSDYFGITNMLTMFAHLWKKFYNIEPTQDQFKDHYKNCEKFIGRGRLEQNLPNDLYLYDHNRSYCSYKSSEYYIGFPSNRFYPRKGNPKEYENYKPSSVVCKSIKFRDSYVEKIYSINKGNKFYLTYPEYLFLLKYADIEVIETLYTEKYIDIDILGFANQFNVDVKTAKFLSNGSIGMIIAGGLKETRKRKYYNLCKFDMEQMKFEAFSNGFEYSEFGENNLKVIHPRKNQIASFHVHSYILSYARIAVMQKMIELENHVYGFTVDCLLIDIPNLPTSDIPGEWKYEETNIKKILNYNNLSLHHSKNGEENDYISTAPEFDLSPVIIIDDIPGSSKTQHIRDNPNNYSVLLEPSIVLRDKKTVQGMDVMCVEKYFYLNQTDKKRKEIRKRRRKYTYIYIDEYLQFEVKQLKLMIEIAKEDGSIIIFLGDHCQIGGNNFKEIAKDTQIIYSEYDVSKKYRHSKENIDKLSILRDKSITTQKKIIIDSDLFTKSNLKDIIRKVLIEKIPIASGNHKRISSFNRFFRNILLNKEYNGNINVRDKDKKICKVNIHSDEIWWNKESRNDKSDLLYLPMFAETIDSIQGDTIESIIVDIDSLDRYGCSYVAVTRTTDLKKTIILV